MSRPQNFRSIKSRGAIQQQMMNKLVDTLEQFLREIIAAQEMFDRCKANPPLTRNQPPVAGGCPHSMSCPARVAFVTSVNPAKKLSCSAELHRVEQCYQRTCIVLSSLCCCTALGSRPGLNSQAPVPLPHTFCRCHKLEPPAVQQGEANHDKADCCGG
jgi:hypothetical protein